MPTYQKVIERNFQYLNVILKVRKTTANKLYESLVTYDDVVPAEVLDDVMTMLSETVWDSDLSEVRTIRNDLCDMIGIPKPAVVTKSKGSDTKTETPDRLHLEIYICVV